MCHARDKGIIEPYLLSGFFQRNIFFIIFGRDRTKKHMRLLGNQNARLRPKGYFFVYSKVTVLSNYRLIIKLGSGCCIHYQLLKKVLPRENFCLR